MPTRTTQKFDEADVSHRLSAMKAIGLFSGVFFSAEMSDLEWKS
jgi:hypothetical protein